jgi:hypothetical protein
MISKDILLIFAVKAMQTVNQRAVSALKTKDEFCFEL